MRDIKYRDDGRPEDLLQELGYETQDIAYKRFSVYGAYFFGFFIFCIISGFFVMKWMVPTGLKGGRMADYVPKTDMPLSAPLLQTNISARTDIMSLRRKESEKLDSPGVIDQSHGVYRIPIDQAIDAAANASDADKAQMGLPGEAVAVGERQQRLADIMTEPDFDEPVKSQKPNSNINRGESATTQPTSGGNGG